LDIETLAGMLDQTLLKPTTGLARGGEWIAKNADSGFATLCVPPFLVPAASARLAGSTTRVCSVVAFPLGYAATPTKALEAQELVRHGCREVDMVINVGALLEGDHRFVRQDIMAVAAAVEQTSDGQGLVKVILETGYLSADQIRRGSSLAVEGGARFVKTSTGFGPRGASVEDVRIMREEVGSCCGVKAAGGIRTLDLAMELIEAGADRIGTSAGAELLEAAAERER
jgi:deoxyribose-phosphate aldolase